MTKAERALLIAIARGVQALQVSGYMIQSLTDKIKDVKMELPDDANPEAGEE